MSIIGRIFNPLNHGEDLKKLVEELKKKQQLCDTHIKSLNDGASGLYSTRKEIYSLTEELQLYLERLKNCPESLRKGVLRALKDSRDILNAWKFEMGESAISADSNNSEELRNLGVATAGGAVALGGTSALMAVATTFGTAGTGAAISSLGGAAATNAALAWLGGGALAAGGGGMATGSLILSLMGPIGWGVLALGAAGTVTASVLKGKKNDETINILNKEIEKRDNFLKDAIRMQTRLDKIIDATRSNKRKLDFRKVLSNENDFDSESFPKNELFEIVAATKLLGKLSKESININEA